MPKRRRQSRQERIHWILSQAFDGQDPIVITKLIEALPEIDQEIIWNDLAKLKKDKSIDEKEAERMDFRKPYPTMRQFIEDEYYLGRMLQTNEEHPGLYPCWKEILCRDFGYDSTIHNAVLTGSIGVGKTWVLVVILLYRLTLITLLRNPQAYFRLARRSNIIFNILSVTREQVRMTGFGVALNFMGDSPYFLEELQFDPDMEYSRSIVPFPNNIFLTAGSKGWHVLGQNLLAIGMDEGNFRLEKDPDKKAYQLFDEVRTRISSRFHKIEGFLPAISLLASSASDESSFTEQVIKDIEKANNPDRQAVYRLAIYKAKRHELVLGDRWFKVAYGLRNMEPFILRGWYRENGKAIDGTGPHEPIPVGARGELVPEIYWPEFRRNCRTNLQSVSGISTGGAHRLFASLVDIERALDVSEKEGVPNPIKGGRIRYLPISAEDQLNIWDFLDHPKFLTRIQSRVQPIRHPNSFRYAHMDLATTSKAGLAICHLVRPVRVEGGGIVGGQPLDEYRLMVEYDFILTITAGQTKPINFAKICRFFLWLRDMCGFRFGMITADMFQSEMPLQELEAAGFKTDQQSLHKSKSPYIAWRVAFEDTRIRLYRSDEMLEEAEKLVETEKDYQHPDNASDDTTDACAGAYCNAVNSEERASLLAEPTPGIDTHSGQEIGAQQGVLMELPTPVKTLRTVKHHIMR
jgi:hypothetical protein